MAAVGSRDTAPELVLRRGLHARGFRFRLHVGDLPGTPDIVLPKHKCAVFVNGCFWHGHDCALFQWPRTRPDFWRSKIGSNQARDRRVQGELIDLGWRVLVVWECAIRGRHRISMSALVDKTVDWLSKEDKLCAVRGHVAESSVEAALNNASNGN